MPNYVSPGVYVIEKDVSDFAPTLDSSVVGIVGFADKGPIAGEEGEKATLVTSQAQLVKVFGEPKSTITGQGLEGALEILESTNKVYFVRAAEATAARASTVVSVGSCPRAWIELKDPDGDPAGFAGASALAVGVSAWDNTNTLVYESVSSDNILSGLTGTASKEKTFDKLATLFANNEHIKIVKTDQFGITSSLACIVNVHAGTNAKLDVVVKLHNGVAWSAPTATLKSQDATFEPNGPNSTGIGTFNGHTFASATDLNFLVNSKYKGSEYNLSTLPLGKILGNSVEIDDSGTNNILTVNNNGQLAESFVVNLNKTAFVEDVLGTGKDTAKSEFLYGTFVDGTADLTPTVTSVSSFDAKVNTLFSGFVSEKNARFIKLVEGSYPLAGGNSGNATGAGLDAAVIGGITAAGGKKGIQALDDETLDISIALVPDTSESDAIQNALVTLAEKTQAFIACISPPRVSVASVQAAVDWSNGFSEARTAALNSSYAAVYWPWVKVFSTFDGIDKWMAPEIFAARQMVYTDAVSDPWFAPAGYTRGRLTKPLDVEITLNQGDRDSLYSPGNIINPITKFPRQGIVIFGQRTAQRDPTALDRVNIRRLMIVIRKTILAATRRLVFEPNDPITWARVESILNPMFNDIKARRGITEFKVVCDETTNTPLRIDRNEMWTKVLIKPTKTAEVVVFELNLVNQSTNISA